MTTAAARVVIGIGLSSRATAEQVERAIRLVRDEHGLGDAGVTIATRRCFVDDGRLALGHRVVGCDDDVLVANSRPVARTVGLPARVAETAALLVAGPGARLLGPVRRGAHVTVAVAASAHDHRPAVHP